MYSLRTDVEDFLDGKTSTTTRRFIRLGVSTIPDDKVEQFRSGFGDKCNSGITFIGENRVTWLNEEDSNGYFYILNTKGHYSFLTFYGIVDEHNMRVENPFTVGVIDFLFDLGARPIFETTATVRLNGHTLHLANDIGQVAYYAGLGGNWSFDVREVEIPCFVRGDSEQRGKVISIGRSFVTDCMRHFLPRKSAYDWRASTVNNFGG